MGEEGQAGKSEKRKIDLEGESRRRVDTAKPEKNERIDRGEVPSSNPYKTAGKTGSGREV